MRRGSACLLMMLGCQHWHYEHNAPGHIDVAAPPRDLRSQEPEEPTDPGENLLVVAPGAFVGGGPATGGLCGTRPRVTAGLVTSLEYGWSAWSHAENDLFGVLPPQSVGLVVGWNFFEDDRGQRSGPLFFDAQYRRGLTGVGAGWA